MGRAASILETNPEVMSRQLPVSLLVLFGASQKSGLLMVEPFSLCWIWRWRMIPRERPKRAEDMVRSVLWDLGVGIPRSS